MSTLHVLFKLQRIHIEDIETVWSLREQCVFVLLDVMKWTKETYKGHMDM